VFSVSVPEVPLTLTACCAISAVPEAEKVKVAELPGVTDREVGEAVTPLVKPVRVTDTEPVKPPCPATETSTA